VKKGVFNMMITTVVAVALGLAPVNESNAPQTVSGDYSAAVGRYSQTVDRRGTSRVRGVDSRGVSYELVLDKRGYVEATVGERSVSFRVRDAS
jgi:hypothetical protein